MCVCVCVRLCVCVLSLPPPELQLNCQACPAMSPVCQSRETSNCTPQTLQLLAGEWVRTMQIDKKGNALHEKPIYDSATDCVHPETLNTAMEVSLTASFVNFITFLLEFRDTSPDICRRGRIWSRGYEYDVQKRLSDNRLCPTSLRLTCRHDAAKTADQPMQPHARQEASGDGEVADSPTEKT